MKIRNLLLMIVSILLTAATAMGDDAANTAAVSRLSRGEAVKEAFEFPRIAARQYRPDPKSPARRVTTHSCEQCKCGYICNDFQYCNQAFGSNCRQISFLGACDDCSICTCW